MHTAKRMQALTAATFALVVQVVFPATPAMAVSGIATVARLVPASGPAGTELGVSGGGCVSNGVVNSAEVLLRGPGASTTVVSRQRAPVVDAQQGLSGIPVGSFVGPVVIPGNAVTGSTYTASAQCTEQGQPPGPESAGVVFTVTAPGTGPAVGGTVTGAVTGVPAPSATTGRATTTGPAAPIASQPRFTG